MREIKFRGMGISGKWFYGNLAILPKNIRNGARAGSYISNSAGMPFAYQVRPETVGQFTGLKDKNDKEIYEGDIIEFDSKEWGSNENNIFVVRWNITEGCWDYGGGAGSSDMQFRSVIGNIYENPQAFGAKQ